jgi:hypothetical protein
MKTTLEWIRRKYCYVLVTEGERELLFDLSKKKDWHHYPGEVSEESGVKIER